jgi:D-alanine--poly(phosphoribitol) ligase subunit 2
VDRNKILDVVYSSIKKVNEDRQEKYRLQFKESTVLFGQSQGLDSLDLVTFIVDVEQNLADELNIKISLTDEKAMSQKNSPFSSVKSLVDYIQSNIGKK